MSGIAGTERHPVAIIRKRPANRPPASVSTVQHARASSNVAAVTRVLSRMSRRRSKRSATWLR